MESLLCEKWELQPKHSSTEVLQRWRDLCGVVKNPKRRFRFTANIAKRHEAAQMRKTNQVASIFPHSTQSQSYIFLFFTINVPLKSSLFFFPFLIC